MRGISVVSKDLAFELRQEPVGSRDDRVLICESLRTCESFTS